MVSFHGLLKITTAMQDATTTIPDRIDETESPTVLIEFKVEVVPSESGRLASTTPMSVFTVATLCNNDQNSK